VAGVRSVQDVFATSGELSSGDPAEMQQPCLAARVRDPEAMVALEVHESLQHLLQLSDPADPTTWQE
jgi:hypothetical protein